MSGLTGVQARNRVRGATAIAQRNIDQDFHSLFIATKASGLAPFDDVTGLRNLAGHTLTFGSETSTSGRLMPQHFLQAGGLDQAALKGKPGFSGSHDATIEASKDQLTKFVDRTGTAGLVQLDDRTGALYKHFRVTSQSSYRFVSPDGSTEPATGPLDEGELSDLIDQHTA